MSNVTLTIAGRDYTVACGPGEESHVAALGRMIDAKLAAIPGIATQSEPRRLLYAALLLADEVHEAHRQAPAAADEQVCAALETMAARLESLAERLESEAASP